MPVIASPRPAPAIDKQVFNDRLIAVGLDWDELFAPDIPEIKRKYHTSVVANACTRALSHATFTPQERAHWAASRIIGTLRPDLRCVGSRAGGAL